MTIKEYIKQVVDDVIDNPNDHESSDGQWMTISFDIGLDASGDVVEVEQTSSNRIKFSLEVKRD